MDPKMTSEDHHQIEDNLGAQEARIRAIQLDLRKTQRVWEHLDEGARRIWLILTLYEAQKHLPRREQVEAFGGEWRRRVERAGREGG